MTAYCSTVPWESLSKIVKKQRSNDTGSWPRLEDEFWSSAIRYGTGGTCYESNWAFFCLLQDLGFDGYLTINKIADKSSIHSAIVITINDRKYIVDIGYPTYAPIPLLEVEDTISGPSPMQYRCIPLSATEYRIENLPHPRPYLYHLTDIPVTTTDYLKIASADYGDCGLFSDRVIIRKVINNVPTRFDSEDCPYNIHTLHHGEKRKTLISAEDLAGRLSRHFAVDRHLIERAFQILNTTNPAGLQSAWIP